jgi:hypothetical protein
LQSASHKLGTRGTVMPDEPAIGARWGRPKAARHPVLISLGTWESTEMVAESKGGTGQRGLVFWKALG